MKNENAVFEQEDEKDLVSAWRLPVEKADGGSLDLFPSGVSLTCASEKTKKKQKKHVFVWPFAAVLLHVFRGRSYSYSFWGGGQGR